MADARLSRPRHRKQDIAAFTLKHIIGNEAATGFQYAFRFRIHPVLCGNVHGHMQRHGGIEGSIPERQAGRISLLEVNAIGKTDPTAEFRRGVTERLRDVDARDMAAKGFRQGPRWSAKAAADIEHARAGLEVEVTCQLKGGLAAADMKLVDGCQIGRRELVHILAGLAQTVRNRAREVATATIVTCHITGHG